MFWTLSSAEAPYWAWKGALTWLTLFPLSSPTAKAARKRPLRRREFWTSFVKAYMKKKWQKFQKRA